jgi:hypothetical protein
MEHHQQDGEGNKEKTKSVKTKILETLLQRHWQVGLKTRLSVFVGTPSGSESDDDNTIELQSRDSSRIFVTSGGVATNKKDAGSNEKPPDKENVFDPIDINLTWLIQTISKDKSQFSIDRFSEVAKETCRTPRRNADVQSAVSFLMQLKAWSHGVVSFFRGDVALLESYTTTQHQKYQSFLENNIQLARSLFHPTLPLLENSTLLSDLDLGLLLEEQVRRIEMASNRLQSTFQEEDPSTLASALDAKTILMCSHLGELVDQYIDSINYIEHLLKTQITRAIGKEVSAELFEAFMRGHYQKLFGPEYAPKLFSYAVRRPNHYPDGMLSIEGSTGKDATQHEPVQTFVRQIPIESGPSIFIPINAATSIEIKGERYLHGWLQNRFDMSKRHETSQFRLAARAHQFSSFVLVVGLMAGPNKFKPSRAIILQNKDELLIPLLTEIIPSAKEFKDAISSLSPEQKDFARAFRAMQLESSIFGVCLIQLKPQLEKLLGLPPLSLTKEIQLTQDLMSLFIDFSIPSDLLGVHHSLVSGGDETEMLNSVKDNVKAVLDIIDKAKQDDLLEEKRKSEMRKSMHESTMFDAFSTSEASMGIPLAMHSQTAKLRRARRSAEFQSIELDAEYGGDSSTQQFQAHTNQDESNKQANTTPPRSVLSDFTLVPKLLDAVLEKHDRDGSLHSTKVEPFANWSRMRKENLLTPSKNEQLLPEAIETEQKKAFDLLDALSRSGSLPIAQSELHVVVVVSHCFEEDVMSTVVKDNINPIEKVEKSSLIVASIIHGQAIEELVEDPTTLERLRTTFPALLEASVQLAAQVT